MVRRLACPPPPPPLVWSGRGGGPDPRQNPCFVREDGVGETHVCEAFTPPPPQVYGL